MKFKRIISIILGVAMSLAILPSIPAIAETESEIYTYDGYQVEYTIQNDWTDNQSVELTITNTGDESILNWALKYDATGEINNLYNGVVYNQDNTEYIIKNAGYNYEIAPDQRVTFGYTLNGNSLSIPKEFEIYSKRVDVTEGYDVNLNTLNSWDTVFQGELVISNTSDTPLEAWMLSFDSNFIIDNLWDGRILESSDMHYTVSSQMWTNPIQPGSYVTIKFTASKTSDITAEAKNFVLSVVQICEDNSDVNNEAKELVGQIVTNDNVDVSNIKIDILSSLLICEDEDTSQYTNTFSYSVYTDKDGYYTFAKPSDYCLVQIDMESLPIGTGVDNNSIFIEPNEKLEQITLSKIADINIVNQDYITILDKNNNEIVADVSVNNVVSKNMSASALASADTFTSYIEVNANGVNETKAFKENIEDYSLLEKADMAIQRTALLFFAV